MRRKFLFEWNGRREKRGLFEVELIEVGVGVMAEQSAAERPITN